MKARLNLIFLLFVCGCGTYRSGSGGYKGGVGAFKTSSEYGNGVDSGGDEDDAGVRNRLKANEPYFPRSPFKLYWPVEIVRINRGFHPAEDPHHEGIDLGGKKGFPILAAHEGRVIYVGHEFHGYGNMILVEYNAEWATLYGHLDEFAVREGQVVAPGDPIGAMGSTGHATGVHLHFELMHNRQPVDPLPFLTRPSKITRSKGGRSRKAAANQTSTLQRQ